MHFQGNWDIFKEIVGKAATPAGDHLFKVREDGQKLNDKQEDAFHHTVYKLLIAANQVCRDIQTTVSFLTTRVQEPDKDDWGKLKRILKYLNGTWYLKLTLSADQLKFTFHWYVDGSHQIHKDCRGQTGSLVTSGKGVIASSSNKMKGNTKSSTETELVLLADKLSNIVWMGYFIECQGYGIDKRIIFQDNMSALSLKKNGHVLSSKRTKHIKAKCFLIKDYYDAGEIDVRLCPTDGMWADVLTKPLQGQKLRDMRAFPQGCPRIMMMTQNKTILWTHKTKLHRRSVLDEVLKLQEERVGKIRACAVSHGQMRHRLFLMKRQERGPLRVMQTHHLKISKSKTTWPNHVDKRYKRYMKMLMWPKNMQGTRVRATK